MFGRCSRHEARRAGRSDVGRRQDNGPNNALAGRARASLPRLPSSTQRGGRTVVHAKDKIDV